MENSTINELNPSNKEVKIKHESDNDKAIENGFVNNEDTRSELKFDKVLENTKEVTKRKEIEEALKSNDSSKSTWQKLAIDEFGLVGDDLRKKIWPLLLDIDPNCKDVIPSLQELSTHTEYNQVVLDVDRSLSRFPPGIPLEQRLALQDQLTVLILRVIIKYPHLMYYQGYHDVAITFLLVVGEVVSFKIMEYLSTNNLRECMEATMDKTSYRLNYIYALLEKVDEELFHFLESASVGTMFALPWFLTWFGHSLNHYKDVVRLYDYFLSTPPLMPLYVATSLVIERKEQVLLQECDMAMIHCFLSKIPDDINFEPILKRALVLYQKHPPKVLEEAVQKRVQREKEQRRRDEARIRRNLNKHTMWGRVTNHVPAWLLLNYRGRYGLLFATATILIGLYAYYLRANNNKSNYFASLWNT